MKSALWSIAKYIFAVILLIIILRHADADRIMADLRRIPPWKLLLSLAFTGLAQVISGLRMRFFFRATGFQVKRSFALILFFVGAFYNFLLPGGIGGDAYKIILTRKRMSVSAKDGFRIMLADRASGLCIVMLFTFAALWTLDFSPLIPYSHILLALATVITMACYLAFSWWLMKQPPRVMLLSLGYSLVIQSMWVASLLAIWSSLGTGSYAMEYIALYGAASVAGLAPVTVGGLGVKEMTYYGGATQLRHFAHSGVDGDLGIAISLCLFVLAFVTSLPGILWLNKVERADHA